MKCIDHQSRLSRSSTATQMWYIRRRMRIAWTEKESIEKVMEMAGHKRSLLKTIRKRKVHFFVGL